MDNETVFFISLPRTEIQYRNKFTTAQHAEVVAAQTAAHKQEEYVVLKVVSKTTPPPPAMWDIKKLEEPPF